MSLEPESVNASVRLGVWLYAAAWLGAMLRWRRTAVTVGGLLGLVFLTWLGASVPLERLYGLLVPGDRARNLSWCMTVAAGNGLLTTGVVGQVSLEPFWALLVATVSLFSPERVLLLYPVLPLAGMTTLALVLFEHFRRFDAEGRPSPDLAASNDARGLLVAFVALFLTTPPLDFLSPYRAFFAKMFLLKPNHTLGLVLLPVVLAAVERGLAGSRRAGWVRAGLWLGLLALVFVVHWAFLCVALAIYGLVRLVTPADGPRLAEARRLVGMGAVGAAFVAPGVYLLLRYYPAALTLARGTYPEAPMRSDWGDVMPSFTSLLFQASLDHGAVFFLALVGGAVWWRRRSRRALLWLSCLLAAYALWAVNYALYLTARAREADEFYFFLAFVLSVAAGEGLFAIVETVRRGWGVQREAVPLALALVLPMAVPAWWAPARMDVYFRVAMEPIPNEVLDATDWIRENAPGTARFLAPGDWYQWIPALTGRRAVIASPELLAVLRSGAGGAEAAARVAEVADFVVWDDRLLGNEGKEALAAAVGWSELDRFGPIVILGNGESATR